MKSKKPTTLNDIINPKARLFDALNLEDKFIYMMLYMEENKKINSHQAEAIEKFTDKAFIKWKEDEHENA
tara:strand:+ start:532 stop:741 length:210 start_codon:yes stop_codon:yes gene_type:complete